MVMIRYSGNIFNLTTILTVLFVLLSGTSQTRAGDVIVNGTVTDDNGSLLSGTRVSFFINTTQFTSVTGTDGRYTIRISGTYGDVDGMFEAGQPFPNPFSGSVNIPFTINTTGDILFTVYNIAGQKIRIISFRSVTAGSYRLIWDGCNQGGSPQRPGFYFYGITFGGRTYGGRLVKAPGISAFKASTSLEAVMIPPETGSTTAQDSRFSVITEVTREGYYPLRLTDITLMRDTTIDFTLTGRETLPFMTSEGHIARYTDNSYRNLILKGVNLGSSPPGYFPGEIAYAITPETYERWISEIAAAGFNSVRVYTLHPPVFYEKLAEYNQRHPSAPLLLFQGIWLEEVEDASDPTAYDLFNRETGFSGEIEEVIDCIHGNNDIAFRYGKAYGVYKTDMSRWTAGYIIGREVSSQEVDSTDHFHPLVTTFNGSQFAITTGSPSEVFVTRMLDKVVTYEKGKYSENRPVSFSSWPTLDPLHHPTEIYTDEDAASFDLARIEQVTQGAGLFASYHAYPYYPNFISQQPEYRAYSDSYGPDSYLGYLTDLKNHYNSIPLVIAEFGVPSSWASAHQSYSSMNHGGYSEQQQGEKDLRMMHNIIDAGCAGGFVFAWMDEWFKRTWIVMYLEAYGIGSGADLIPTRQLWHNETSPEQCFGLIAFEQEEVPAMVPYTIDNTSGAVTAVKATNDEGFFYLEITSRDELTESDRLSVAFDTYLGGTGESQLPDGATLTDRSEFMLDIDLSADTASYYVTQAYDMKGLTIRFNLSNPVLQKYKSTVSDGAPWNLMTWINDEFELTADRLGRVPVEKSGSFSPGSRSAVTWEGKAIRIRIPWTMLHFNDPTQMTVNDGAVSYDGGYNFDIITSTSDGIAVSVYLKGGVTSSTNRYRWTHWLTVPKTVEREKESLQIMKSGLQLIPDYVD